MSQSKVILIFWILTLVAVMVYGCGGKKKSDNFSGSGGGGVTTGTGTGTGTGGGSGGGGNIVNETEYENEVFDLVNEERAAAGVSGLIWDEPTAEVARAHSRCMRDHGSIYHICNYGHGRPEDRLAAGGVSFLYCAENVAKYHSTPSKVMTAWMNSSGHRKNILSAQYTHIGIGLANPGSYWTQNFLQR
ncbi:MAG: hypothetical protein E3J72_11375 [Planctomycetota bacterium]|nr:MAG: hypothetical protein E3J72_11375 [Planctomycetota bacterium]